MKNPANLSACGTFVEWAWQDSNDPTESAGKPAIPGQGAAKSAANASKSGFSDAVRAIMALPLTDAEKADAVRRLLNQEDKHV
jgi:hypothetical protein